MSCGREKLFEDLKKYLAAQIAKIHGLQKPVPGKAPPPTLLKEFRIRTIGAMKDVKPMIEEAADLFSYELTLHLHWVTQGRYEWDAAVKQMYTDAVPLVLLGDSWNDRILTNDRPADPFRESLNKRLSDVLACEKKGWVERAKIIRSAELAARIPGNKKLLTELIAVKSRPTSDMGNLEATTLDAIQAYKSRTVAETLESEIAVRENFLRSAINRLSHATSADLNRILEARYEDGVLRLMALDEAIEAVRARETNMAKERVTSVEAAFQRFPPSSLEILKKSPYHDRWGKWTSVVEGWKARNDYDAMRAESEQLSLFLTECMKYAEMRPAVETAVDAMRDEANQMFAKMDLCLRMFAVPMYRTVHSYRTYVGLIRTLASAAVRLSPSFCASRKADEGTLDGIMCRIQEALVVVPNTAEERQRDRDIIGFFTDRTTGSNATHAALVSYKSEFTDVYQRELAGKKVVVKIPKRPGFSNLVDTVVGMAIMPHIGRVEPIGGQTVAESMAYYGVFSCEASGTIEGEFSRAQLPICNKEAGESPVINIIAPYVQHPTLGKILWSGRIRFEQFKEWFRQIWTFLIVLSESPYRFSHNDLHDDNMFVGGEKVMIFDYDWASFTLNGDRIVGPEMKYVQYGVEFGVTTEIQTGLVDFLQFFNSCFEDSKYFESLETQRIHAYTKQMMELVLGHIKTNSLLTPFHSDIDKYTALDFKDRQVMRLGNENSLDSMKDLPEEQRTSDEKFRRFFHNVEGLNKLTYLELAVITRDLTGLTLAQINAARRVGQSLAVHASALTVNEAAEACKRAILNRL